MSDPMVIPQVLTQRATGMSASATRRGAGRSPSWPSRSCSPSRTTCTARSPTGPPLQMTPPSLRRPLPPPEFARRLRRKPPDSAGPRRSREIFATWPRFGEAVCLRR